MNMSDMDKMELDYGMCIEEDSRRNEKTIIVSSKDLDFEVDVLDETEYERKIGKDKGTFKITRVPQMIFNIEGLDSFVFMRGESQIRDFLAESYVHKVINEKFHEEKGLGWEKINITDEIISKFVKEEDREYICGECGKDFVNKEGLSKHKFRTGHELVSDESDDDEIPSFEEFVRFRDFMVHTADKDKREEFLEDYKEMIEDGAKFVKIDYHESYPLDPEITNVEFLQSYDEYEGADFEKFRDALFDNIEMERDCEDIRIDWDTSVRICRDLDIKENGDYLVAESFIEVNDDKFYLSRKLYPKTPLAESTVMDDLKSISDIVNDLKDKLSIESRVNFSDAEIDDVIDEYEEKIDTWGRENDVSKSEVKRLNHFFNKKAKEFCLNSDVEGKMSCFDFALLDLRDEFDDNDEFLDFVDEVVVE